MLIYEYKLDGSKQQFVAIDEAIKIVQFIRNKCLRLWMDERGIAKHDLQVSCAVLAKEYPFAHSLNSQARQANAALNILAKALERTLGHRETDEHVSSNASGQIASTRLSQRKTGKRAG